MLAFGFFVVGIAVGWAIGHVHGLERGRSS